MSLPVVLTDDAEADYDEAYRWFESQRSPSGERFADAIQVTLARIGASPLLHQKVFGEVRRATVPGYRYYVVYYMVESARVVVISVFHTSRDPAVWQARVP